MLLAVMLGSGVQVFGMTVVTLAFACLGFLSPATHDDVYGGVRFARNSGWIRFCARLQEFWRGEMEVQRSSDVHVVSRVWYLCLIFRNVIFD
jgi:hypothetical protein